MINADILKYPFQFDNESERPFPVSFTSFRNLKRLKVAPVYIWGNDDMHSEEKLEQQSSKEKLWKSLPPKLEELWLHRAQQTEVAEKNPKIHFVADCLLPALQLVFQNKTEAFPKLKRFRIEFEYMQWEAEWFGLLASVCAQAREKEVHCTIILEGKPYSDYPYHVERNWGWYEEVEFDAIEFNTENRKIHIDTQEEPDLAERLRGMQAEYESGLKEDAECN